MDFILSRYKNVTVLLVVIAAQLVLVAYQVKSNQDVRLLRIWSVTAITPVARLLDTILGGTVGFVRDYFVLLNAREENRRLREDLDRVKMENQFLRTELSTADRARVLAAFQARTPSRTVAARIIANATGANSKVVFVDRGSSAGVLPGMAVITPDGIAGKVLAVYPTASQVMLIYDPSFAAGVISERHRVQGIVKGQGHGTLIVEHVPAEMKVEPGEKFYSSGDDRIFPKGLPVGEVKVVRPGRMFKEIFVAPTAFLNGLEEVLIVIEGVHQALPGTAPEPLPHHLLTPPGAAAEGAVSQDAEPSAGGDPALPATQPAAQTQTVPTETDRIRERYLRLGDAQGVRYGRGGRIPNFNASDTPAPASAPGAAVPPARPTSQP